MRALMYYLLPSGASGYKKKKQHLCEFKRCKRRGFDLGSGTSPGEGHDNPLQYSCLENPMDRGDWQAMVHRVAKSWAQLKQVSIMCMPRKLMEVHLLKC